jgi:3-hydroxyisobutyrate dehydrogenase-like beta-hydroxyacid dehydrogenase
MKVGIAGLGRMGSGMANTLLRNNVDVFGYDINRKAMDKFTSSDHFIATKNISELFSCDYVILSLPEGNNVIDILKSYKGGSIIMDTTTISLNELQKILDSLGDYKSNYISCKLERGPQEANEGKLALFLGGDEQLYIKSLKILHILGSPMYIGTHYQATMMKLISNMIGTAVVDIFGEMSVLIRKLGIDPKIAIEALSMGGANSITQMFRLEWQSKDEFGEAFSMELAQHVIEMALESARDLGVSSLHLIEQNNLMMKLAKNMGFGSKDVGEISKLYWNLNDSDNHLQ